MKKLVKHTWNDNYQMYIVKEHVTSEEEYWTKRNITFGMPLMEKSILKSSQQKWIISIKFQIKHIECLNLNEKNVMVRTNEQR